MAQKNDDGWDGWVPNLKRLAEELVERLISGARGWAQWAIDTSVAVACIESAVKGQATANQTIVAAAILAHTEPNRILRVPMGFHKDSIAGWIPEDELVGRSVDGVYKISAFDLAMAAADHQARVGLHGKREPFGYSAMYVLAYLLFAIHEEEQLSSVGWRLLKGEVAIFRLTRGWEVGCRTEGAVEPNMSATLGVLGVPGFEFPNPVPSREWFTTARIFRRLAEAGMLLPWSGDRRIETIQGAIEQLVESDVRCAPGFEWMQDEEGWSHFGLRSVEKCEKKGGVCAGLWLTPGGERFFGSDSSLWPKVFWRVVVSESGPRILTSPSGSVAPEHPPADKPEKPAPPPRPEPDLLDPVRAWVASDDTPKGAKNLKMELLQRLKGIKGVPK